MWMKFVLTKLLKNLLKLLVARPMLMIGGRWLYSLSETKIDDTGFEAVIAAYDGDFDTALVECEKFLEAIKKEIINKKT